MENYFHNGSQKYDFYWGVDEEVVMTWRVPTIKFPLKIFINADKIGSPILVKKKKKKK